MGNYVIKKTMSEVEKKVSLGGLLKEITNSWDDFDVVYRQYLSITLDLDWTKDHVHYNSTRLINTFSGFGRDKFSTRSVNYHIDYGKKKDEVVTFVGRLNDTTLQIKITKEGSFGSHMETILVDEKGNHKIISFITNEENVKEYKHAYSIKNCRGTLRKMTDSIKSSYSSKKDSELKELLTNCFTLMLFRDGCSMDYLDPVLSISDSIIFNYTDKNLSVEINYNV